MDGRTIGLLSEYIAEIKRRDRDSHRNFQHSSKYSTQQRNVDGTKRDKGRDERCGTDDPGKSGNNL